MGYIHFLAIVGVWRSPKQTWKILKEINRPMKDELPIEHGKLGIAMLLYYSVAFFYYIFQFWDVEPICDHWVIGWSAMAFWWYFDLGATQTKHHEQVPWDWRSIHIYQPYLRWYHIHIRRYRMILNMCSLQQILTCCNQHIYSSSGTPVLLGFASWDEALAELKKQKGKRWFSLCDRRRNRVLVERKVLEKGWASTFLLGALDALGNRQIESRKMYEDDKMHD